MLFVCVWPCVFFFKRCDCIFHYRFGECLLSVAITGGEPRSDRLHYSQRTFQILLGKVWSCFSTLCLSENGGNSFARINYLDDIILWGRTQTEHDHMLKAVIQRLQDAGLKLNQSKCPFNKPICASWDIQLMCKEFNLMRITSQLFYMHLLQKMRPNSACSLGCYHGTTN